MSTTVDTTGPIALNDVIITPKRIPQIKPHEPPAQPTDTVDLSNAAKQILGEAPGADEPIVTYADGYYPVKQPVGREPEVNQPAPAIDQPTPVAIALPQVPTIIEPAVNEPVPVGIELPLVPTKKIPVTTGPLPPVSPTTPATAPPPVAIDEVLFPRKPLTPTRTPVATNPVTIDKVSTKFTPKGKLSVPVTTLQTSGAARLSSIAGHFIAPYNTAQFLKLFKA